MSICSQPILILAASLSLLVLRDYVVVRGLFLLLVHDKQTSPSSAPSIPTASTPIPDRSLPSFHAHTRHFWLTRITTSSLCVCSSSSNEQIIHCRPPSTCSQMTSVATIAKNIYCLLSPADWKARELIQLATSVMRLTITDGNACWPTCILSPTTATDKIGPRERAIISVRIGQ